MNLKEYRIHMKLIKLERLLKEASAVERAITKELHGGKRVGKIGRKKKVKKREQARTKRKPVKKVSRAKRTVKTTRKRSTKKRMGTHRRNKKTKKRKSVRTRKSKK
jgi:hypothetical protein